jgi:hypothetical protein
MLAILLLKRGQARQFQVLSKYVGRFSSFVALNTVEHKQNNLGTNVIGRAIVKNSFFLSRLYSKISIGSWNIGAKKWQKNV